MSLHRLSPGHPVEDDHRLAEAGILGEDDRVELLDGQVIEMSPIDPRHTGRVNNLARLLTRGSGTRWSPASKLPLYAAARIPEAWLVDLEHDVIEVRWQPGEAPHDSA